MAVLVGVVAHGAEDDAGNAVLGGDLAHSRALHLHAVGGAFGLDGGFGGAVAHEHIAGGDLACQSLDACVGAGFFGGGDKGRVAGVLLQERRILADHIQLSVVVKHRLADDHVADADLACHVACDAGEDDLLGTKLGDDFEKIAPGENVLFYRVEIRAKCRRLKQTKNLELIVIDYLQLMQSSGRTESRQNEIAEISRSLKILAKELNIPVIALSQLSRAAESRSDKRPMLSDLRESGAIEQDADMVMFLYRDEYYNPDTEDKNLAECIVAKNRSGETGMFKLGWKGEYTKFSNVEFALKEE